LVSFLVVFFAYSLRSGGGRDDLVAVVPWYEDDARFMELGECGGSEGKELARDESAVVGILGSPVLSEVA